mmetsp:Transcript_741/g.2420  ORF Transcript_741/g.2420 Transcript_741/m.2420 type:complete len:246 (+) Transcript_741:129-866(+)|eukprot:CAMPEP_0198727896 /NCGR_PEP_ID=MMETSP1475-20131203/6170_1 /TAXON_ID= ORGANISM="Unidentified sp., Strain CCMP1999" /NCGR_SAMPLE_ID=MMETSP1475 /ASSEMBLY_ACC=CAM_ASM_001111 /LENGTH=245 /DNA_ID=CAMNT_0044490097 /DNA_START=67 /DNA_END=804 /DNA_ORIENTATION=+
MAPWAEYVELMPPLLGAVLSNLLFMSPIPTVMKVRSEASLGNANPLPYIVMLANNICWCSYGSMIRDKFQWWANGPGMVMTSYYVVTTLNLAPLGSKQRFNLEMTFMTLASVVASGIYMSSIVSEDTDEGRLIVAWLTQIINVLMYAAPLSTISTVLKNKSANSIDPRLAVMSFVNTSMWLLYGLTSTDIYVWLPASLGSTFAAAQLALIALFWRRDHHDKSSAESAHNSAATQQRRQTHPKADT